VLPWFLLVVALGPSIVLVTRWLGVPASVTAAAGLVATLLALSGLLVTTLREHRRLVTAIETRDAQLVTVLDRLPIGVMVRAADGRLLHLNPSALDYVDHMGVDVEAIRPSPSSLLEHVRVIDEHGNPQHPDLLPVVAAVRDTKTYDSTLGYEVADGDYAWYRVRTAPMPLTDGTTGIVVTLDNITEQHQARHELALAERSLRLTFEHAPIGIAILAVDGQLLQANPALCALLGRTEQDLLAGSLAHVSHPDELEENRQLHVAWIEGRPTPPLIDRRFAHASGRWLETQLSVAVVRDDDGTPLHLIAQVVDLSMRRALEAELRAAAVQDPLTGLANRRELSARLQEAELRREREPADLGLLFVDLDDFKEVNDTHGHDVGDRVLVEAGRRLVAATRDTDTVCRIGGDEFVVLCAPIDGERGLSELVARITNAPPLSVAAGDGHVEVAESVGAVLVAPGEELDAALRRADAAMYATKRGKFAAHAAVPHRPGAALR
jgi:diguanylate cyclase (GGDEF)-like protein/PAS domain S-box-containing protein